MLEVLEVELKKIWGGILNFFIKKTNKGVTWCILSGIMTPGIEICSESWREAARPVGVDGV